MTARLKRWAMLAGAAAVLALVFMAYLQPGFLLDLANRFYTCF